MLEPHVRKLLCKGVGQVVLNGSVGQLLDVACLLALSHETDGKFVAELKRVEWLVTRVEVFDLRDLFGGRKVQVQKAVGYIAEHEDGHEERACGSQR